PLARDLHSLPTRRSSDLLWPLSMIRMPGWMCREYCAITQNLGSTTPSVPSLRSESNEAWRKPQPGVPSTACQYTHALGRSQVKSDRKSTRLNSSHVKISY